MSGSPPEPTSVVRFYDIHRILGLPYKAVSDPLSHMASVLLQTPSTFLLKKKSTTSQSGPARRSLGEGGFLNPRILVAVLLCTAVACLVAAATSSATASKLASLHRESPAKTFQRTFSFAERVSYQRAIEDVYWRHRIWPKENSDPKPSLDAVMTQEQLENKVAEYLGNSQALGDYWKRPITAEQLQAEMERMAQHTRQPEVLRELFEALGNDAFVIAECLARPVLAERWLAHSNGENIGRRERMPR